VKAGIIISHIYSSPEHHYFMRDKFDIGTAPTFEHDSVVLEPGRGIRNDRFEFSTYPLTFISEEVMREVCKSLDLIYRPSLFRRNIVISGINLNQLVGKRFVIRNEFTKESVAFEGTEHCAPCTWMNAVMKKGAYKLMVGRGGLRAKVTKGGSLQRGTNILITDHDVELLDPLQALTKPNIPH
jgi:hypothetical protein